MKQDMIKVAKKLGFKKKDVISYGDCIKLNQVYGKQQGNLILVTATNPTDSGIGKTTVSIGLADALNKVSKTCVVLREPSLGPVFGKKGCATGGGKAQVVPEEINLHFTGDFHAITSANNLLCAMIDNSIYHGNPLHIDKVVFTRCLDMNDRELRSVTLANGRKEKFVITPASEIMAIMALAKTESDLRRRLENIIIGYTKDGKEIKAKDLNCVDAMMIVLKDAFKVNLAQTLEGTPAMIHLGPFANIAHGCNSVRATGLALSRAKFVVTEAGFGADLGMEKFLDVKCNLLDKTPSCVVLVTTTKSLMLYGGGNIQSGFSNLDKHIDTIQNVYGLPLVVTVNVFSDDANSILSDIKQHLENIDVPFEFNYAFTNGGVGTSKLAKRVIEVMQSVKMKKAYAVKDTVEEKICKVAQKVYGARNIILSKKAKEKLESIKEYKDFPIMIAKTPYSLSGNKDDQGKILEENIRYGNKPYDESKGFDIEVTDLEVKGGAEFIVVYVGGVLTMPGLNQEPNATKMKFSQDTCDFMF